MSDIKRFIKALIFPPRCKCCGRLADDSHLCRRCAPKLEEERIPADKRHLDKKLELVDGVYASYYYNGPAVQAVKYAKFRNPAPFLHSLLDDISIDINSVLEENNIDMIMAVPCYKSKFYKQEYDLPREMVKIISAHFSLPAGNQLKKIKKTARQHDLPLDKRRVNLINAYDVSGDVKGRNILIIDDVTTSGNTLSAAATELRLAGADRVYAWVYTYNTYERKNNNGNNK